MPAVRVIPATHGIFDEIPLNGSYKRKTAGYSRVSTDLEEQQNSYKAQVDYYTKYIVNNPDWEFVNVYTDEGLSATSTAKRDGFNRMIADALAGKIDLICTKSISRFARNTVDTLTTIRKLKEKGVEVFFEKENLHSLDSKGELFLSILASLAQEESHSISENVRWGLRKRMKDGKVSMPYSRFLGYEKGEDGIPSIVESEAVIVRRIYSAFLDGDTPGQIARKLTVESIPTPGGKRRWLADTIESVLTNEKYKGCALLQKKYKPDLLSKQRKNTGALDQYYIEGSHPSIVSPEIYEAVQQEMAKRKDDINYFSGRHVFSNKVYCGECGHVYTRKVWHSTSCYKQYIWRCGAKYEKGTHCKTPHLTEAEIERIALKAINSVIGNRDELVAASVEIKETLLDVSDIDAKCASLITEMDAVYAERKTLIDAAMRRSVDNFVLRDSALAARSDDLKRQQDVLTAERAERVVRANRLDGFMEELRAVNTPVDVFDESVFVGLIERITVHGKDDIRVKFRDGTEMLVAAG
ncbi:serine recombinase [Clostridia bacterium]|nr:serine recombinase [Clostridia bacterium]